MGIGSFFKKIIPKEIRRPIKAIVDPAIDLATNVVKAVVSPFTGGFDLPDVALDVNVGSAEIKAATTVDFNAANRNIPVLYGNNVTTGTIPVFIGTHGADSADTSPQYLYMAAVISQGFHGTAEANVNKAGAGAVLSRLLIDGKPVHLRVGTQPLNNSYFEAYDGSTDLGETTTNGGIRASGFGGNQPTQHTIDKGTFANRLKIQYFDGSADQPASSLLREHPDWDDDNNTLSGIHYLALRFEIKAADEVVGGFDGDGTYGNPYSSAPAVVTTTTGRATMNFVSGHNHAPGYRHAFDTTNTLNPSPGGTLSTLSPFVTNHRPLSTPDADGIIGGIDNVAKVVHAVPSDTVIEIQEFTNFQAKNFIAGGEQPFNIHDFLFEQDWSDYKYVFMVPSEHSFNSDSSVQTGDVSEGLWLENVGAGHYRLMNKQPQGGYSKTISGGAVTFYAYDSTLTESKINASFPGEQAGDSTTAEYRFYSTNFVCNEIAERFEDLSGDEIMRLRVINDTDNTSEVYQITSVNTAQISDPFQPYITVGIYNEDSSALPTDFYTSIAIDTQVYIEIQDGTATGGYFATPSNLGHHVNQGYVTDGTTTQGYFPDTNPVEHLLDYMLNPNYGLGLTFNDIDKQSFLDAARAADRVPNFANFNQTQFDMGENLHKPGAFLQNPTITAEYMYGPNALSSNIEGDRFRTNDNGLDRQFKIDTSKTHLTIVNELLTSMGAIMPVVNGKFKLLIENAGVPDDSEAIPPVTALPITAHIKDEHVIDAVTLNTASINDKFNRIKLDYTDLVANSQPNSAFSPDPIEDSTNIRTQYLAEDNNKPLEGNFTFKGIFDRFTAQKTATLLLKKSRGQPVINMTTSAVALNCLPGDFVRFESETMKINDVFRVTSTTQNNDHTVGLVLIRHVPEFYDVSDLGQTFEARKDIIDLK